MTFEEWWNSPAGQQVQNDALHMSEFHIAGEIWKAAKHQDNQILFQEWWEAHAERLQEPQPDPDNGLYIAIAAWNAGYSAGSSESKQ